MKNNFYKPQINTTAQKRLLFVMDGGCTLKITNNETAALIDCPQEDIQVRTCSVLIKSGLLKIVDHQIGDKVDYYYRISEKGVQYCEKSRKRKPKNGISSESISEI